MSSTIAVDPPLVTPAHLTALYEPIAPELAEVDAILRRELRSEHRAIDELVKHSFRLGGKRLRPALLLLAAKAAGGVRPEHLVLGAVMEMIHRLYRSKNRNIKKRKRGGAKCAPRLRVGLPLRSRRAASVDR